MLQDGPLRCNLVLYIHFTLNGLDVVGAALEHVILSQVQPAQIRSPVHAKAGP
jgi:hypothetical protein